MANSVFNGRRFTIDGLGIISSKPLWISKIFLKPNAAGDAITLSSWNENATPKSKYDLISITTGTATMTDAATAHSFVTANVAALDVIKILATETGLNDGYTLVLTRDSDEIITTVGKTLTAETADLYSWKIWTPTTEGVFTCDAATGAKAEVEWCFGRPGLWVPNLAVTTLSASATAQIFLG